MRRLAWALAACCLCDELFSYIQTPNQLKRIILISNYVCVDNYRLADLIILIMDKHTNYTLLYLWAEIVWADLAMGRNWHGPILLWAEMSSDPCGFGAQLIGPIQLHVKRQNSSICKFFQDIAWTLFCLWVARSVIHLSKKWKDNLPW